MNANHPFETRRTSFIFPDSDDPMLNSIHNLCDECMYNKLNLYKNLNIITYNSTFGNCTAKIYLETIEAI